MVILGYGIWHVGGICFAYGETLGKHKTLAILSSVSFPLPRTQGLEISNGEAGIMG